MFLFRLSTIHQKLNQNSLIILRNKIKADNFTYKTHGINIRLNLN